VRLVTSTVTFVLAVLMAGLAPLAFADPPDPTWIGGYWDDDDFDNVVDFIGRADVVVGLPPLAAGPSSPTVIILELPDPSTPPAPVHATASPRAPPLSSSSS
jgi:hypothetical protein